MAADDVLFRDAKLVIAVGSGGVGKTTTSAALAVRAACAGRRVLVLTIDPAKRLANAMGLPALENEPQPVDLAGVGGRGTLDAAMLDAVASFDTLIRTTAGPKAPEILGNRVYRMMVDHFAGVQEYMAVVRLYDAYTSGRYDLIVLDTPPAKHAMDFFSSSTRAAAMFDERIMRWFLRDTAKDAGLFFRVFNPGAVVLKLLAIIGGEQFIAELSGFFQAMSTIRADLHERGERVRVILSARSTRYVVVASPDPRRIDESAEFYERLKRDRQEVALFVLNRSHDAFRAADLTPLREAAADAPRDEDLAGANARVSAFYSDLLGLADRDRGAADALARRVGAGRIRTIPAFAEHIHTLRQLLRLSDLILGTGDDPVDRGH